MSKETYIHEKRHTSEPYEELATNSSLSPSTKRVFLFCSTSLIFPAYKRVTSLLLMEEMEKVAVLTPALVLIQEENDVVH